MGSGTGHHRGDCGQFGYRNSQKQQQHQVIPIDPSFQSWQHKMPSDVLIFLDLTKFKTEPCPYLSVSEDMQRTLTKKGNSSDM